MLLVLEAELLASLAKVNAPTCAGHRLVIRHFPADAAVRLPVTQRQDTDTELEVRL